MFASCCGEFVEKCLTTSCAREEGFAAALAMEGLEVGGASVSAGAGERRRRANLATFDGLYKALGTVEIAFEWDGSIRVRGLQLIIHGSKANALLMPLPTISRRSRE